MEEEIIISDNIIKDNNIEEVQESEDIAKESSSEVDSKVEMEMAEEVVEDIKRTTVLEEEVIVELNKIDEKIDALNALFVKKIQHTSHEEKIVDQMHSELQKYKDDMYSQLVRPILLDIIEVRNSILRISQNYAEKDNEKENSMIPLKIFSDYALDIQDILEKNNISIYEGTAGEEFNPSKQRVIKKVKTSAQEMHGKVAERLACGYEYLGKTISPEKVAVYLYEETKEEKGENK